MGLNPFESDKIPLVAAFCAGFFVCNARSGFQALIQPTQYPDKVAVDQERLRPRPIDGKLYSHSAFQDLLAPGQASERTAPRGNQGAAAQAIPQGVALDEVRLPNNITESARKILRSALKTGRIKNVPYIPCSSKPRASGAVAAYTCDEVPGGVGDRLKGFVKAKPALIERAQATGLTVMVSTFARDNAVAQAAVYYATCPFVREVVVVFHNPKRQPPVALRDLGKHMNSSVKYRILHPAIDTLSNRYNSTGVTTDAIFQIDDDRKIPCEYVEEAFLLWQFLGDLSFVLPFYDAARWLNFMTLPPGYDWRGSYDTGKYNSGFVTQGGIMHKFFYEEYFGPQFAGVRAMVAERVTAEDIVMAAVHATFGGPVLTLTRHADRVFLRHDPTHYKGSLASTTARRRTGVIQALIANHSCPGCATCTWWDLKKQVATSELPALRSKDVEQKAIKFEPAFYATIPPLPAPDGR